MKILEGQFKDRAQHQAPGAASKDLISEARPFPSLSFFQQGQTTTVWL